MQRVFPQHNYTPEITLFHQAEKMKVSTGQDKRRIESVKLFLLPERL